MITEHFAPPAVWNPPWSWGAWRPPHGCS